jgi:hypothetical protein
MRVALRPGHPHLLPRPLSFLFLSLSPSIVPHAHTLQFLGPPTPGVIGGVPARRPGEAGVTTAPGEGGPPTPTAATTAAAATLPPLHQQPPAAASRGAFARVYGRAAPTVAARLHAADPVLAEWIR